MNVWKSLVVPTAATARRHKAIRWRTLEETKDADVADSDWTNVSDVVSGTIWLVEYVGRKSVWLALPIQIGHTFVTSCTTQCDRWKTYGVKQCAYKIRGPVPSTGRTKRQCSRQCGRTWLDIYLYDHTYRTTWLVDNLWRRIKNACAWWIPNTDETKSDIDVAHSDWTNVCDGMLRTMWLVNNLWHRTNCANDCWISSVLFNTVEIWLVNFSHGG